MHIISKFVFENAFSQVLNKCVISILYLSVLLYATIYSTGSFYSFFTRFKMPVLEVKLSLLIIVSIKYKYQFNTSYINQLIKLFPGRISVFSSFTVIVYQPSLCAADNPVPGLKQISYSLASHYVTL